MTSGTFFYVEESSVCDRPGSVAIADRCADVLTDIPLDAGTDWPGTLENIRAVDPELAAPFAGLEERPNHPLRVWTTEEIEERLNRVVQSVVEQTRGRPATVQRVENGFLVVSSPERLLNRRVDLDPDECPAVRGDWRRPDQQRCALAQFQSEGIGILPTIIAPSVGGGLEAADGRVWHDTLLWQVYGELLRGYSERSGGFVLLLENVHGPGTTGVRRSVRIEGLTMGQPAAATAPIAIPSRTERSEVLDGRGAPGVVRGPDGSERLERRSGATSER